MSTLVIGPSCAFCTIAAAKQSDLPWILSFKYQYMSFDIFEWMRKKKSCRNNELVLCNRCRRFVNLVYCIPNSISNALQIPKHNTFLFFQMKMKFNRFLVIIIRGTRNRSLVVYNLIYWSEHKKKQNFQLNLILISCVLHQVWILSGAVFLIKIFLFTISLNNFMNNKF